MPHPEYSLPDALERIYENQLALEAAIMELSLWAEQQGGAHVDQNVRGALETIGENAGHIKQGLARLPAMKKAGVRYRRPYQTRHTYASMMLSAGEHPMWVAKQMGHTDWTMIVRVYGRWMPSADTDAGNKAEKLWNPEYEDEFSATKSVYQN